MLSILLIEDDPIDLISIKAKLKELGYDQIYVSDHNTDLALLVKKINPGLIISDIYYDKKPLGLLLIDICDSLGIPLILITADTRMEPFNLASRQHKVTYLVKPFHHLTLMTCIDMLLRGGDSMLAAGGTSFYIKDFANNKVKLFLSDILFIRADGNFCHIQCQQKHYMVRISLSHFGEVLDDQFAQVHKSFIVNKSHVDRIVKNHIVIIKQEIPIGRKYRNVVLELFPVLK